MKTKQFRKITIPRKRKPKGPNWPAIIRQIMREQGWENNARGKAQLAAVANVGADAVRVWLIGRNGPNGSAQACLQRAGLMESEEVRAMIAAAKTP